jgi:protein-tyrosine-phosphatase
MVRRLLRASGRTDLSVSSCGVQVVPGTAPGASALTVAREHGVELDRQRAVQVARHDLAAADLVVTMTEGQRSHVCRVGTGLVTKTFTLVELCRLLSGVRAVDQEDWRQVARTAHLARPRAMAPHQPEDVPDPIGRSIDEHRLVAAGLEVLCQQLVACLQPDRPAVPG